jgi:hypothetical protein
MLDIVDVEGKREPGKYPIKQGGFDLIWDNGPVSQFDKPTSLPTMLGCFNYRDQNQLRKSLAELAAEDAAQQQQGAGGGGSLTARLRKSASSVAAAAGEGSRQGLAASAACQLGL